MLIYELTFLTESIARFDTENVISLYRAKQFFFLSESILTYFSNLPDVKALNIAATRDLVPGYIFIDS